MYSNIEDHLFDQVVDLHDYFKDKIKKAHDNNLKKLQTSMNWSGQDQEEKFNNWFKSQVEIAKKTDLEGEPPTDKEVNELFQKLLRSSDDQQRETILSIPWVQVHFGKTLREKGNYSQAEIELKKAHKRIDKFDDIFKKMLLEQLCLVYQDLRDLNEAGNYALEFIELYPQDARGYVIMADLLRYETRFKDAIRYIKKAIELEPDNPNYRAIIADIALSVDKHDIVRRQINFLQDQQDDNSRSAYHFLSAKVEVLDPNPEKSVDYAIDHLQKSIEFIPTFEAYGMLIFLYHQVGESDKIPDLVNEIEETLPEDQQREIEKLLNSM